MGRWFFTTPPRAMGGLTAEELAPVAPVVWAEHTQVVDAFSRLLTQWTIGPMGPVGIRYEAVDAVFRRLGIPLDDLQIFDDLRTLESAALSKMKEDRANRD